MRIKVAIVAIAVVAAGCGGGAHLIIGPDLLNYVATSQVTSTNPMRFSTTVVVSNTTTDPITFTPSCPIPRTLVYTTAARTGTPIWDSNTRSPLPACTASVVTLGVNKTVSFTLNATGAEALGAAGTPGTYYLLDIVTLDGANYAVSAGQVDLAR